MANVCYKLKHVRTVGGHDVVLQSFTQSFPIFSNLNSISGTYDSYAALCTAVAATNGATMDGNTHIVPRDDTIITRARQQGVPTINNFLAQGDKFYLDDVTYFTVESMSSVDTLWAYYKNGTLKFKYYTKLSYQNGTTADFYYSFPWYGYMERYPNDWFGVSYVYQLSQDKFTLSGNAFFGPTPSTPTPTKALWEAWLNGIEPVDTNDPYVDIPDSQPSGPAQTTGIPSNDPVDIPNLPTVSASDTGFISLFNPTEAQVKSLADYLWTGLFDINTFRKIFADPMDCILGFNLVPVNVPSGSAVNISVGNVPTTIAMNPATSQWVEVDCGSVTINEWIGNYMDYAPASKYSIFLPYIGIQELSTDDLVGKTLTLKYHVDVLSCACVAFLKCGDSVLYQFAGSCGYSIPVTGNDFSQMISNICRIITTGAGAVASGGLSAGNVGTIVDSVMGLKPTIHRSGSVGSSTGLMGIQTPFLIMELPNLCKPTKQYHYQGYPSFVTKKLSDISGYAEFESILVEGVPCTEEEQTMIKTLCKEGIYL